MSDDLRNLMLAYAVGEPSGSIVTAAHYLSDLVKCVKSGGSCPVKSIEVDGDVDLKAASEKLTFCQADHVVLESREIDGTKAKRKQTDEIPEDVILEFDGRMSTRDKDRDGDILEPKGMILVEKMPLLWQHNHSQPLGVMVKNLVQDEKKVDNKYWIIDSALGRDAKKLVRLGALRLSHGFDPLEGEVLDTYLNAKGEEVPTGFHLTKLEVYETSLVSVPANAKASILRYREKEFDALCSAKSAMSFETDAVKGYLGAIYDRRPKVFKGWTPEPTETKAETNTRVKSLVWGLASYYAEGSFERTQEMVSIACQNMFRDKRGWTSLAATFSDHAYYTYQWYDYDNEERHLKMYRVPYTVSEDGQSVELGESVEVEVKLEIAEKMISRSDDRQRLSGGRTPIEQTVKTAKQETRPDIFRVLGL